MLDVAQLLLAAVKRGQVAEAGVVAEAEAIAEDAVEDVAAQLDERDETAEASDGAESVAEMHNLSVDEDGKATTASEDDLGDSTTEDNADK